jgi:sulfotransferase family protein
VFLVGCPRSGTTLLFELLRTHPQLASTPREGHVLWSAYNHPRRHGWRSDALGEEDVSMREHRYLETMLAGLGPGRPLDKTPKNVLRLPYLRKHFPAAHIILLIRDGRSTVASLLEGWRLRRGASYLLPRPVELRDYRSRIWRYLLPPGWRGLSGTELANVATTQYEHAMKAASIHRNLVDVLVRYEDLVDDPTTTVSRILHEVGLARSDSVYRAANTVQGMPRGALSPPRPDKWKDVADDLAPYLQRIEHTMRAWRYDV